MTFCQFLALAQDYESTRMYTAAAATYLIAASHAEDIVGEDIALTYAWWMHERAEGRISELETPMTNDPTDTPDTPDQTPVPQGDGDPTPASEPKPADDADPVL